MTDQPQAKKVSIFDGTKDQPNLNFQSGEINEFEQPSPNLQPASFNQAQEQDQNI